MWNFDLCFLFLVFSVFVTVYIPCLKHGEIHLSHYLGMLDHKSLESEVKHVAFQSF